MHVKILGNLNSDIIDNSIIKTEKLIKIPTNLYLYFLENINFCYSIKLPRHLQDRFKLACGTKISFSLKFRKRKIIVVYVDKDLLADSNALIGLLLHEIIHINQMDKGIYKKIHESYNNVYQKNFNLFSSLKYDKNDLKILFNGISSIAVLTLKDIYVNNELIMKGLNKYLISYYKFEFNKKICPKPIFYQNLKKYAKKDLNLIKTVFEFELSLISVILPLYKIKKAWELVNFIENCYELNINEISKKCHELINLYFTDFSKKGFNEAFIDLIFLKVYTLIE